MSRQVPEFALVTGVVLALTVAIAGVLFTDDLLRTLLVSLAAGYPFVAYAAASADDPTNVLVPGPTAALGALFGLAAGIGGLLAGPLPGSALFGLFLALIVFLPAAGYAAVSGGLSVPLPAPAVGASLIVAGSLVLGLGVVVDALLFGTADAALLALAGALYADRRGSRLSDRQRDVVAAGGALAGLGVLLGGLALAGGPGEWVVVAVALALVPAVYASLAR